uniref:Promotilin n=1 Tax=Syphacia muris TaxID=451379 RepID=A0A0N5AJV2_9BILA
MRNLPELDILLLLVTTVVARPPTQDEEEAEGFAISDTKADYDTLPEYRFFSERVQQMLRSEKLRYLQLLKRQPL